MSKAALTIQKTYHMCRVRRQHYPQIAAALQERKHTEFMQQQVKRVQDRKRLSQSVKVIEK
jgi:hypothetical protein